MVMWTLLVVVVLTMMFQELRVDAETIKKYFINSLYNKRCANLKMLLGINLKFKKCILTWCRTIWEAGAEVVIAGVWFGADAASGDFTVLTYTTSPSSSSSQSIKIRSALPLFLPFFPSACLFNLRLRFFLQVSFVPLFVLFFPIFSREMVMIGLEYSPKPRMGLGNCPKSHLSRF